MLATCGESEPYSPLLAVENGIGDVECTAEVSGSVLITDTENSAQINPSTIQATLANEWSAPQSRLEHGRLQKSIIDNIDAISDKALNFCHVE